MQQYLSPFQLFSTKAKIRNMFIEMRNIFIETIRRQAIDCEAITTQIPEWHRGLSHERLLCQQARKNHKSMFSQSSAILHQRDVKIYTKVRVSKLRSSILLQAYHSLSLGTSMEHVRFNMPCSTTYPPLPTPTHLPQ